MFGTEISSSDVCESFRYLTRLMLDEDEFIRSRSFCEHFKMARDTLNMLGDEGGENGLDNGLDWRIIEGRCAEPDHGEIPGGPDYKAL